jgi:hypothetical protein
LADIHIKYEFILLLGDIDEFKLWIHLNSGFPLYEWKRKIH